MMFPASAFDSDDERSQSSGSEANLYSDDDASVGSTHGIVAEAPTSLRSSSSSSSSHAKSHVVNSSGLGRANPLSRPGDNNPEAAYSDSIYASSATASHPNMNLRELDAYVQQTVLAQRQQRRKETCTKLVLLMVFVAISATMLGSSLFVWGDLSEKKQQLRQQHPFEPFVDPENYELSQCEETLNGGRSFPALIYDTEQMEEDYGTCRPEVPDCDFINPTLPMERHDANSVVAAEWHGAFQFNVHHIQGMMQQDSRSALGLHTTEKQQQQASSNLDVVLIGDSIVEHWEGKDMGISEPTLHRDHEVFEELFTRHGGGQIDGMAHGIGGDRCANLLYRLENGEMPEGFNPKVWWLLVGTEDWKQGLDTDAIVAGIVKIVETIRDAHPKSHIVVNSILPRGNERRDENPHYAALHDINQRLECYVETQNAREEPKAKNPHLAFFNATSIFLFEDPEVGYFVNPALLPDYVHPSAQGEEIWGRKIVEQVLQMIGGGKH